MSSEGGIIMRPAHFPGRAPIDAYGNNGFRFADMSHRGSILCMPSGIHGWEPKDPQALVLADFARMLEEARDFDVVLIGMGMEIRPIPKVLREAFEHRRCRAHFQRAARRRPPRRRRADRRGVAGGFGAKSVCRHSARP
jgi:uncharacterized protein